MYTSLLPILKPLVFEGKSGVLEITHQYNDQARIHLKEGIIVRVETKTNQGRKAAAKLAGWVSITTEFVEGNQGTYPTDPEINTNDFLSYLKKVKRNIDIIAKKIQSDKTVFKIDSTRLHQDDKLNADDFKMAFLFDGRRTVGEVVQESGKSELSVLIHTCKLILSGVASQVSARRIMDKEARVHFLRSLNDKLIDMVGPAGPVLVDDAMKAIGTQPYALAFEDIPSLLREICSILEDEEKKVVAAWGNDYFASEKS